MKKLLSAVTSFALLISMAAGLSFTVSADAGASGSAILSDFDTTNTVEVKANGAPSVNFHTAPSSGTGYNGTAGEQFQFGTGDGSGYINIWVGTGSNQDWSQYGYFQFWVSSPGAKTHLFGVSLITTGWSMLSLQSAAKVELYENGLWRDTSVVSDTVFGSTAIEIPAGYTGPVRMALNSSVFAGLNASSLTGIAYFAYYAYKPYYNGSVTGANMLYMDNYAAGTGAGLNTVAGISPADPTATALLTGCEAGQPAVSKTNGNYSQFAVVSTPKAVDGSMAAQVTYTNGSNQGFVAFGFSPTTTDWSRADAFQFYVDNTQSAETYPLELFSINFVSGGTTMATVCLGAADVEFYNVDTRSWSQLPVSGNDSLGASVPTIRIPSGARGYVRIRLNAADFSNFTSSMLKNVTRVEMYSIIPAVSSAGPSAYFDNFSLMTTGVSATITAPGKLHVQITAPDASFRYQIWGYTEMPDQDSFGNNSAAPAQDQWVLWKTFDSTGFSQDVSNAAPNSGGQYSIAVLGLDASGNLVDTLYDTSTPESDGAVSIQKILVNGKSTSGTATVDGDYRNTQNADPISFQVVADNAQSRSLSYLNGGTAVSVPLDDTGAGIVDFAALPAGSYTFTAQAIGSNGTKDQRHITVVVYSAAAAEDTGVINGMTFHYASGTLTATLQGSLTPSQGETFAYRYSMSEPGCGAICSSTDGNLPLYSSSYGVYCIFASVGHGFGSYDDAILSYYTVSRENPLKVGTVSLNGNNIALPAAEKTVTVGSTNTIEATASRSLGAEDTLYSFWRNDARGWVLVRGWSTDGSLTWVPACSGSYQIQVRVKGSTAGSYENAQSIPFTVTGNVAQGSVSFTSSGNTAHMPVTLTAASTGAAPSDMLLYRYDVIDPTLGTYILRAYSPDPTYAWVPRKAGTYTVIVKEINQNSFGMYDQQYSSKIVIQ